MVENDIPFKITDPAEAERLIRKLEDDPIYFIEVFLGRQLSPKQQIFIQSTKKHNHIVSVWSRQTGKSTVIASYILWRLLYGKGIKINNEWMAEHMAIVAPIKDQIKNLYDKIKTLVDKSEFIASFIIKMNTEIIIAKNGNEAKFLSASPGSQIRGYTATCIIIDESQDITDAKYSGDVLPFGATTNALVIEAGTPKTKNHFWSAISSKQIYTIKQPWFECPFLSEEYVMNQKNISPDPLWRQEYLCFHPDTYILSTIPKKIKAYKVGDLVYGSSGSLVSIKGVLKRKISEEVLKITVWNGNSFICTKEHPIYSSIRTGVKNHPREELKFNEALKLKIGDFIHFPKLHTLKKERRYTREELRLFGLWVAEGSVNAKEHTLPDFIFELNEEEKFDFLSGYLDGIGYVSGKNISCSSISKELIDGINLLLLKSNIYSNIHCVRNKEVNGKPKWMLQVNGLSYNRLKKLLNEDSIKKKFSKIIEYPTYDLLQIKEIETIQYVGEVYNLETSDNTYLTEIGSVHNCEFVEEGVVAFPSSLFEPEIHKDSGILTGRWNLADYNYISKIEEFSKEKAIIIHDLVKNGATFSAGLDLGKQNDNSVYTIIRDDIRPMQLFVQITFPLETPYTLIAKQIAMFHKVFSPYEFNFDYSNEKMFLEALQENDIGVMNDGKNQRGAIAFTNKNKAEMVSTARILLENYQLQLPKKAESLISQFLNQQFELNDQQNYKYFHPSNEHDDSLWSTLLALKNMHIMTGEEIIAFQNPWEKWDSKIHGEMIDSPKDALASTKKLTRKERDRGYIAADMRRRNSIRL